MTFFSKIHFVYTIKKDGTIRGALSVAKLEKSPQGFGDFLPEGKVFKFRLLMRICAQYEYAK